jgi:hypothetical protein
VGLKMFESTGLLVVWAVCTYIIANIFLGIHNVFTATNNDLHKQLIKRLDDIVHRVEVVEHGAMYYWYDRDNSTFLAQGKTIEEIIAHIKARLPDHIFYLEESNHIICAKHNWEPQLTQTKTIK